MKPSLYKFILVFSVFGFSLNFSNAQVSVGNISPTVIIGGIGEKITINGSGFGTSQGANYVSFLKTNNNYMSPSEGKELKYISWSDTKIEMEMPVAYSEQIRVYVNGSYYTTPDSINVMANVNNRTINPRDYYYLSANSIGRFVWHMHQTYWNNPDAKLAIEEVFKEFRCKTGVNITLANEPSTAELTLTDDINLIAPLNTSLAGYNSRSWSSCGSFYAYTTQDIELSDQQNYYYGSGATPNGTVKFRYVLMHELSHSLGLAHVNEFKQTMYPSVTFNPSDDWSERDSFTSFERTALIHYVNLSRGFSSPGCDMYPLGDVVDCNDVYGVSVGTNNLTNQLAFHIYPNPSNGIVNLHLQNLSVQSFRIINTHGQVVKQIHYNGQIPDKIDLTELPRGMYSALLTTTSKKVFTTKFVISN